MMAQIQRAFLTHLYRKAARPEELPWHSEKVPELLELAVAAQAAARRPDVRALDVGCGSGVFSLWLAQHGYRVTAVDFMAEAARMTRERVRDVSPEVEVMHASVLEFAPRERFDLFLDRGCLH
jgi:2-polyprenyl-3-methyl-5-hydroxy-6-metoxy-1,4-benzoquinol methylase